MGDAARKDEGPVYDLCEISELVEALLQFSHVLVQVRSNTANNMLIASFYGEEVDVDHRAILFGGYRLGCHWNKIIVEGCAFSGIVSRGQSVVLTTRYGCEQDPTRDRLSKVPVFH